MNDFFKKFGRGILNIFVLPGMVIALAILGVGGLFLFVFTFFKSIFLFFTGRSLYSDLPDDKTAALILKKINNPLDNEPSKPKENISVQPRSETISTPNTQIDKPTFSSETPLSDSHFVREQAPEMDIYEPRSSHTEYNPPFNVNSEFNDEGGNQ